MPKRRRKSSATAKALLVKDTKLTARDIEVAIAYHFDYTQNLIVPNVSWGLRLGHECDLLILRPSGYLTEIEIKVSAADIKKDLEKKHKHLSSKIRELYFAVPLELVDDPNIPDYAGIISVQRRKYARVNPYVCRIVRRRVRNAKAKKISDSDKLKLLRLGCLRIWNLKKKLNDLEINKKKK